ncbi:MAG: M28 family peptidase, partial [Akkermansiaceae bacterium]|nr:M28 family peptidase [Akkermansiaceae bacterium]
MIKTIFAGILVLILFIACGEKEEEPKPITGAAIAGTISEESVSEFSGKNAFAHVEALTAFGPRPIGSEAYQKSLQYLETELAKLGWKTKRQTFTGITPIGPQEFTNLLARYSPDSDPDWNSSTPFLLCSHLDTKLFAEFEFLGVNDSGSSTGVLVEMARVLSVKNEGAKNVELVFFDGEEAILKNIQSKDGLYGSRYYAAQLEKRLIKPQIGIVLDIVGDPKIPLLIGGDTHQKLA